MQRPLGLGSCRAGGFLNGVGVWDNLLYVLRERLDLNTQRDSSALLPAVGGPVSGMELGVCAALLWEGVICAVRG